MHPRIPQNLYMVFSNGAQIAFRSPVFFGGVGVSVKGVQVAVEPDCNPVTSCTLQRKICGSTFEKRVKIEARKEMKTTSQHWSFPRKRFTNSWHEMQKFRKLQIMEGPSEICVNKCQ